VKWEGTLGRLIEELVHFNKQTTSKPNYSAEWNKKSSLVVTKHRLFINCRYAMA
jgi:hypothetical protein